MEFGVDEITVRNASTHAADQINLLGRVRQIAEYSISI